MQALVLLCCVDQIISFVAEVFWHEIHAQRFYALSLKPEERLEARRMMYGINSPLFVYIVMFFLSGYSLGVGGGLERRGRRGGGRKGREKGEGRREKGMWLASGFRLGLRDQG